MSEKDEKHRIHIEDWEVTDLPHLLPYGHHRGSAAIKPEDMGKSVGIAMKAMYQQTDLQLDQIKEQINLLAVQAQAIQDRVRVSEEIYQIDMSFEPVIGNEYYLYQRSDGSKFLSMIAPQEWKDDSLLLVAKVKLLGDRTWSIMT